MKRSGTRQHRIWKREEILFELLNSSLALGQERSDSHRDSFEGSGAVCKTPIKLDRLPPSTAQSRSWEVQHYLSEARLSIFRRPFGDRLFFLLNEKRVPDVESSGMNTRTLARDELLSKCVV